MTRVRADQIPASVRSKLGLEDAKPKRPRPLRAGLSDHVPCAGRCKCGLEFPNAHQWERHHDEIAEPRHWWRIDLGLDTDAQTDSDRARRSAGGD